MTNTAEGTKSVKYIKLFFFRNVYFYLALDSKIIFDSQHRVCIMLKGMRSCDLCFRDFYDWKNIWNDLVENKVWNNQNSFESNKLNLDKLRRKPFKFDQKSSTS